MYTRAYCQAAAPRKAPAMGLCVPPNALCGLLGAILLNKTNMCRRGFSTECFYVMITKIEYTGIHRCPCAARVKRERSENLRQDRCCEAEPHTVSIGFKCREGVCGDEAESEDLPAETNIGFFGLKIDMSQSVAAPYQNSAAACRCIGDMPFKGISAKARMMQADRSRRALPFKQDVFGTRIQTVLFFC